MVIALAGPAANLFLALLAAAVFKGLIGTGMLNFSSVLPAFLIYLMFVNMLLLFFNLIPVPPLDGSKLLDALLYKLGAHKLRQQLEVYGPNLMLILVVISLLTPINVFFFVIAPSVFACDMLAGVSCIGLLTSYAGG